MSKLNMDFLTREAQRIQSGEIYGKKSSVGGGNKDFREIEEFEWIEGANQIRLMYPTYAVADVPFLAHLDFAHWQMPPNRNRHTCLVNSYPALMNQGVVCPVCDAVGYLWHEHGIDCSAQQARARAKMNCIDRKHEELSVLMATLPLGMVYNWLIDQMAAQGIDPCNSQTGIDLFITKSGEGQQTDYKPSFAARGASPLHPDPAVVAKWEKEAYDLTKIFKCPDINSADFKQKMQQLELAALTLKTFHNVVAKGAAMTVNPGMPAPQSPAAPTPAPFVSAWTNTKCSICMEPQYTSPSGNTCKNGHGGAPAYVEPQKPADPPPPPVMAQPTPPPPQPVVAAPATPPPPAQPQVQAAAASATPAPPPPVQSVQTAPPPPAPTQSPLGQEPPKVNSAVGKPPCFKRPASDKSVVHDGVTGGNMHKDEPRCMLCPVEPECTQFVLQNFPDEYKS